MNTMDYALIYLDYIPDPEIMIQALLNPAGFEESRRRIEVEYAD